MLMLSLIHISYHKLTLISKLVSILYRPTCKNWTSQLDCVITPLGILPKTNYVNIHYITNLYVFRNDCKFIRFFSGILLTLFFLFSCDVIFKDVEQDKSIRWLLSSLNYFPAYFVVTLTKRDVCYTISYEL